MEAVVRDVLDKVVPGDRQIKKGELYMSNEYKCPDCGRKVQPKLITDYTYVLACKGCHREYGLPWTTRHYDTSDPPTVLVGAEPWSDAPATELKQIVTGAPPELGLTGWALMGRVIPSLVVAAGSIVLLLHDLVHKPTLV